MTLSTLVNRHTCLSLHAPTSPKQVCCLLSNEIRKQVSYSWVVRLRQAKAAPYLESTEGKYYQAHKAQGISYTDMLCLSAVILSFCSAGHYTDWSCVTTSAWCIAQGFPRSCETSAWHCLLPLQRMILPSPAASEWALLLKEASCVVLALFCLYPALL